eukprot:6666073-Prymnesium_polylepis.1
MRGKSFELSASYVADCHTGWTEDGEKGGAIVMLAGRLIITRGSRIQKCDDQSWCMPPGTESGLATTKNGGAISMSAGDLIVDGGSIIAGRAQLSGGALFMTGGTAVLTNCVIENSTAPQGSAIYFHSDSVAAGRSRLETTFLVLRQANCGSVIAKSIAASVDVILRAT